MAAASLTGRPPWATLGGSEVRLTFLGGALGLGLFLLSGGMATAQPNGSEPAPAPRVLGPAPLPHPAFMRRSAYEVWQYYGVDRQGFFKPLVIYSPYGAYYLYDGTSYPWAQVYPRDWMPYVVD